MAIPISINELLNGNVVESNRIEFKADLNPTPVLHSICAFANDIDNIGGGYIVIGVEEENGPPERRKPRNVGILMFGTDPQRFFRYARIEVVDIPDETGNGMTEKTFAGTLQVQLADALNFIRNYVCQQKIIKHNDRAEADRVWNYPYRAVEEILSNAVYHRSYQIQEPITVRITKDAMEITSFPGFDRSITDEDIASGKIRGRIYRNRRIGDFLKELGMIEGRNTGFPNAYAALKQNGSDSLRFQMDPERSWLSVTIPIHSAFTEPEKENKRAAYRDRVLKAIGSESLTMTEIANRMGYKGITKKMRGTVMEMTESGTLRQDVGAVGSVRYSAVR